MKVIRQEAKPVGYRGRDKDTKWHKRFEIRNDVKANSITSAITDSLYVARVVIDDG